ncbi:Pyruvate decarboxylase 2 [Branchiostoma belcheri]|nr:Pyruvate decarboxylase 2 [Branchiostoma belcheri]
MLVLICAVLSCVKTLAPKPCKWPKSNEIKFKFKYTRGGGEEVRLPEVAGVPGVQEPGDHHEAERVQQQPEPEEAARGSKKAMDRISVLFACNMTGTDKLTPLVIGSSKNSRCVRGQRVPLPWYANKKAWVTGEIFREWMKKVDREMGRKGKKICLLLNNCTAHPHDVNLRNIRLIFLPANTTSIIQPFDQEIRNFKALYRSQLMQRILNDLDNGTSTAHSSTLKRRQREFAWVGRDNSTDITDEDLDRTVVGLKRLLPNHGENYLWGFLKSQELQQCTKHFVQQLRSSVFRLVPALTMGWKTPKYNKKDVGPMVDAVQKMFDFYKDLGIDMSKDSSVPRSRPTITTRTSWGWSGIPTHGDDVAWRHRPGQQAYCGGGGGDPV